MHSKKTIHAKIQLIPKHETNPVYCPSQTWLTLLMLDVYAGYCPVHSGSAMQGRIAIFKTESRRSQTYLELPVWDLFVFVAR